MSRCASNSTLLAEPYASGSLAALLQLVNLIGRISNFLLDQRLALSRSEIKRIVNSASEILDQWPTNFQRYLEAKADLKNSDRHIKSDDRIKNIYRLLERASLPSVRKIIDSKYDPNTLQKKMNPEEPEYCTLKEAADRLRLPYRVLCNFISLGKLRPERTGAYLAVREVCQFRDELISLPKSNRSRRSVTSLLNIYKSSKDLFITEVINHCLKNRIRLYRKGDSWPDVWLDREDLIAFFPHYIAPSEKGWTLVEAARATGIGYVLLSRLRQIDAIALHDPAVDLSLSAESVMSFANQFVNLRKFLKNKDAKLVIAHCRKYGLRHYLLTDLQCFVHKQDLRSAMKACGIEFR